MFAYISGKISEIFPNYLIIDCQGVGYFVHISLQTYSKLQNTQQALIYTQLIIREDAHLLYGFATKEEKELFNLLIGISGIGPSTALIMLSSHSPDEIKQAISTGNTSLLKSIKGIGGKTAERIIVELKDKIGHFSKTGEKIAIVHNKNREDALMALVGLGFNKTAADKVLSKLFAENPELSTEEAIKAALKQL
ncbi:MAG: Holliday junction ATP-dependent DNA helicase RuvA [Vicingaceae bacterium]|jgi:Holliday junction DNA helicase RuvA|nr:MAG: Holliday junction ATP-dependent DNA helicase RuvA [Vicingaceae bacterium]